MAQYSRATLTDAGVQIARRMMDDDTITMTFTGIASGDGNYSTGEDIAARTALKNQIQFFPLSSKKVTSDNVLHLKYIISNVNPDDTPLTVGYYVREIGIYAQVDSEPAVLYAIAIADSATADYLPEYDSLQPSTITMDWFLTVGNAENVSIAASPSAYALASDLDATNAVVVTKLTASGGDAADAIIGSATAATAEYPVPAANDTFKVILGKIIKFCADIVKTFTGATSSAAGKKGLVPQPAAGDQNDYLRGDSTWQTPVNNALATAAGSVLDARMGKTLQDQITSLNDSLAKWIFGADTTAFRVAGTKNVSYGIRSIADDLSYVATYFDRNGIHIQSLDSSDSIIWQASLHVVTANAAANGTSTVTFTIPSYNDISQSNRKIIATCNGGAVNGRNIVSVIPRSSTTVDVNFSGNVGTTGDIFMTFLY